MGGLLSDLRALLWAAEEGLASGRQPSIHHRRLEAHPAQPFSSLEMSDVGSWPSASLLRNPLPLRPCMAEHAADFFGGEEPAFFGGEEPAFFGGEEP
jgi:hypothetical protein